MAVRTPLKLCKKCSTEKPRSEFFRASATPDGLYYCCKDCKRKAQKEWKRTEAGKECCRRERQTPAGKARQLRGSRKYQANNRDKIAARTAVGHAITRGILKPFDACEHCGSDDRVEAHHPSYAEDMHLCVSWLCKPCHHLLHREFV